MTGSEVVAGAATPLTGNDKTFFKMTGSEVVAGAATPLTGSEESWAIIEEVFNKLQPFIEQCTGTIIK